MGDLAAERLKGEKFHVFRIKGLDTDPWGGRVNARKKPVLKTGSFRSRRVRALFDLVTGPQRDPATEGNSTKAGCSYRNTFSLAASSRIVQAKSCLEPVTNGLASGA